MIQVQDTIDAKTRKVKAWMAFKTKGMSAKQIAQFQHSLDYLHFVCSTFAFKEEHCANELLLLKAHASLRQDAIWEDCLQESLKLHKLGSPEWHSHAVLLCNKRNCSAPNQKWDAQDWSKFVKSLEQQELDPRDFTLAWLSRAV
jgi:hypothetical protein